MTGAIGQLWQDEGEEGVLKWFWDDEVRVRDTLDESTQDANSTQKPLDNLTREDDVSTS
jgi:hypothetical protein